MKKTTPFFISVIVLVLAGVACGIDFGTQPSRPQQPIVITVVVPQPQQQQSQQQQPQQQQLQQSEPTLPQPSPIPPTAPPPPPPTSAPEKPIFTANRDLSCADGPSWYKYNFILKFAEYDSAPIVGINGKYGLVEYKGNRCWVLLTEGTIKGSTSGLPTIEAPPLPIVEVWVENQLGQYVYLVFFDWETGNRVKTLALDPGKRVKIKLPSGYYAIQGYTKKDQKIYQSGMINLGVGDSNKLPGLLDGEAEIIIF